MNKNVSNTLKPKKEFTSDDKSRKQPKKPEEVSQIIQEKQKEKTNLINFRNDRNAVISLLAKGLEDHSIDAFIKTDSNGVKHLFIEGSEKELSDENLLHYVNIILKGTDTRYFTLENSKKYNKKLNKPLNIQKESKKTIVEEHKEENKKLEEFNNTPVSELIDESLRITPREKKEPKQTKKANTNDNMQSLDF